MGELIYKILAGQNSHECVNGDFIGAPLPAINRPPAKLPRRYHIDCLTVECFIYKKNKYKKITSNAIYLLGFPLDSHRPDWQEFSGPLPQLPRRRSDVHASQHSSREPTRSTASKWVAPLVKIGECETVKLETNWFVSYVLMACMLNHFQRTAPSIAIPSISSRTVAGLSLLTVICAVLKKSQPPSPSLEQVQ